MRRVLKRNVCLGLTLELPFYQQVTLARKGNSAAEQPGGTSSSSSNRGSEPH